MMALAMAAVFTLCMTCGVIVKYVPFSKTVSDKGRKVLIGLYAALGALNFVYMFLGLCIWHLKFAVLYLKFGVIVYSLVITVVNIIIIPKRLQEHLFVLGVLLNFNLTMLHIPNYIINFMGDVTTETRVLLIMLMFAVLLVLTCYPLTKLMARVLEPFLFFEGMNYMNVVCYIPLIYFIIQLFDYFGSGGTDTGFYHFLVSVFSGILMVVVSFGAAAAQGHLKEARLSEKHIYTQEVHYKELQVRVEEARKTRHDMKHYISAVNHYIECDDKEGLREFCKELSEKNAVDRKALPYTGNMALDGVIYDYMSRCFESGIEFTYSGTVRDCTIDSMDVCVLIGNALENAYTACRELAVGEGRINLMCKSEDKLLTIVVQNTFDGKIELTDDDQLISRKRGDRIGVGMLSMKSVCDRYGGMMERSWTDDTFNIMFMLPII